MVRLRVLTYNVHGLPWIQCPIHTILTWIELKSGAEIVCLQEVFARSIELEIQEFCKRFSWNAYFADTLPCFGKRYLRFHCPSGLCILVRQYLPVQGVPVFYPFEEASGVDYLVTKGILRLTIQAGEKKVDILNTHFQSDFTDIPCFRLSYPATRKLQEMQLALFAQTIDYPILCGDFNQEDFMFFDKFSPEPHITFPSTGEHLDHMIFPHEKKDLYKDKHIVYFDSLSLSDHIPILYSFSI